MFIMIKKIIALVGLTLSLTANAVVINNINGIDYEWLELAATAGHSREGMNMRLQDEEDELYGYEYASRSLLKDLLFSYAPWDGINEFHGEPSVVAGMSKFFDDFGATYVAPPLDTNFIMITADGYTVLISSLRHMYAHYGATGECVGERFSCLFYSAIYVDKDSTVTTAYEYAGGGWDDSYYRVSYLSFDRDRGDYSSFLVREFPDDCPGFPGGGNTGGEFPGGGNTNGCFPGGGNGHASVPEPGTLPLLALGLAGLVGIRKFRKSQSINS